MRSNNFSFLIILAVALALTLGCSRVGHNDAVSPAPDSAVAADSANSRTSHYLWGFWQFTVDPAGQTIDIAPLRAADLHLNALHFLEPPPLLNLTVEKLKINGNIIDADIGLRHPFTGMDQFTGFDVCGILITNGSITGFVDPDLRMTGMGDTRLLNPDGYSRWWNPAEFPHNDTMLGYKDGLLGNPDETYHYNCTVNAYKYFCDDLTDPNAPLTDVSLQNRGMFGAGKKNVRHYTIELGGEELIFNYAVDASWRFPKGSPPWKLPDSFPPAANRPEAWRVNVTEVSNTLWNDWFSSGGSLSLLIDVYDWYSAGLNVVKVESPWNFNPVTSLTPIGGGEGCSTYSIDITDATPGLGSIDILISVESENIGYGGVLPGKPVTAYFTHTAPVASSPPGWQLVLEDPVQIIDPVHGDWPQLDDFSPTIGETADESLLVLWYAVNDTHDVVGEYEGGSNWGSKLYSFTSDNSGTSWGAGLGEHFGVGAELIIRDAIKSLQYISGSRMHAIWPGYPSATSPDNYVSQLGPTNHSVFWKYKADRQIEAAVMQDAGLVVLSDYGGQINAKVSTGNDWDDPSPFWYPPFSDHPDYAVAAGYLSNVRSLARDDSGKLWLVIYGSGSDISMYSSTDGTNWNPEMGMAVTSDYEDLRDPSIFIDGQEMYLTFTQKHIEPLWYELIFMSGIYFNPEMVVQSPEPITDAQVISGNTSGENIIAITYQTAGAVNCIYRMGGNAFSAPVLISQAEVEGAMPDFIFDAIPAGSPDAYMHFVWCERADDNDNWEVFYRRGYMQND